jgi:fructosamine-3-kinase
MSQEMDISWQVLRRIAQDWGGAAAELAEVKPLDGGCISTTVALHLTDGRKAVCKISSHRVDRSYVNEAHQLSLLAARGVPVPTVYAAKLGSLEDPFSYILMEFIEGMNLQQARRATTSEQYDGLQAELARLVLAMHEQAADKYSRAEISPPAPQFDKWPPFYHHLFDPIYQDVVQTKTIPARCRKQVAKIHERLDQLLQHDDVPRLVHWDVWSTNILVRPDSSGHWSIAALLDPNCKFAHIEAEIAYMALFQTSTPAFMKAYQERRRLSDDYHRLRKPIYQLYFLMNHVHLFGAGYINPFVAAADRLSAVI